MSDGQLVTIAVDFDGTIVKHEYPDIGPPVPNAIESLLWLQKRGVKLILWTMRSGEALAQAVAYCEAAGITFFGINTNPNQKTWTESPKAYAQLYIDDAAFGCPLWKFVEDKRPWVDWVLVMRELQKRLA